MRGGKREGAGKPKGALNKRTRDLIEILNDKGYCPVAELVEIGATARMEYERAAEIFDAIQEKRADKKMIPLTDSNAPTYLKIMQQSAADLMPYMYPKRKAVEISDPDGKNPFASFTEWVKQVTDAKD